MDLAGHEMLQYTQTITSNRNHVHCTVPPQMATRPTDSPINIDEEGLLDENPIEDQQELIQLRERVKTLERAAQTGPNPPNPNPNPPSQDSFPTIDLTKLLVRSNPNTPAPSPSTTTTDSFNFHEQEVKCYLDKIKTSLLLTAKLHHNHEFMVMALERKLAPRGPQIDIPCTLISATELVKEHWDKTLQEASLQLVHIAEKHYKHQLEAEIERQNSLMTSMREEANHASLSSQQKRELKWLITDKLTSHQAEAEKLAKTLANKRSGGAKRPRADTSISPPVPQPYRKGTKNERGAGRSRPRGPCRTPQRPRK